MRLSQETLREIKRRITEKEPLAEIILYGSFARGEGKQNSDIDLLILVNKPSLSYAETNRLTYPLYDYALQTGQLISPVVKTKKEWEERFFFSPLYHNVKKEGIAL